MNGKQKNKWEPSTPKETKTKQKITRERGKNINRSTNDKSKLE